MKKSNTGWNDRQKSRRQSAYQRGSQRDASPHYVLLYSDDEYSGDEENIPLQNQTHSHSPPRKVEVINIQIQPQDTLQALSLRYRCTISDLKRINRIHNDNEIFARPTIKVPVQPFSLLAETVNNIQDDETKVAENSIESKEREILNLITNPIQVSSRDSEINNIILNSVIEPIYQTNETEAVTSSDFLLSSTERQINQESQLNNYISCSGDNWGLKWRHVLGISLLLGLGVPIIYIFYIADVLKYNDSKNTNGVDQT